REEREAGKQRQHRCDEASHPTHIPNLSGSLANDESAGHVLALPFVVAGSGCRPPWPAPTRRRSPKGRSIGANNVRFALGPDERQQPDRVLRRSRCGRPRAALGVRSSYGRTAGSVISTGGNRNVESLTPQMPLEDLGYTVSRRPTTPAG